MFADRVALRWAKPRTSQPAFAATENLISDFIGLDQSFCRACSLTDLFTQWKKSLPAANNLAHYKIFATRVEFGRVRAPKALARARANTLPARLLGRTACECSKKFPTPKSLDVKGLFANKKQIAHSPRCRVSGDPLRTAAPSKRNGLKL